MSRTTVLLAWATAFTLTAIPLAETPASSSPQAWTSWRELLNRHIPGQDDDAIRQIAAWTRGDLEALLPSLSHQPDRTTVVQLAVVLHTDVAMLRRRASSYDLPAGSTTMTLFEDGTAVGRSAGTFHWEFARRLIDQLPPGEERLRIARAFYRAAGALLQGWNEDPELTAHLAAGRRVLGADAVLLLYEGTQQQMYAGARAQRFFLERRRTQPQWRPTPPLAGGDGVTPRGNETPPPALPSVSASRARAEQLFRRALSIASDLAEARIRLAHLLGDRARHAEAAAELAKLPAELGVPLLDYYAALVSGREARAVGHSDAARSAFERALRVYPDAPVPHVALSELATTRGDSAAAVAEVLATGGEDGREPWWAIERVHAPSAEVLVEEMRRAFVH